MCDLIFTWSFAVFEAVMWTKLTYMIKS